MRRLAHPESVVSSDPKPISPLPYKSDREIDFVTPQPALRLVPRAITTIDDQHTQGKHLLVVDSDAIARETLSAFLRQRDFRVWVAANAAEAHAMLIYKLPNLVLIETHLTGVSGIELIRQLRRKRRTTLLPIIITSALTTPRDIRNGLAVGADDYITKPLELSVVEARINALLRRDERLRMELSPLALIAAPPLDLASELN